MRGSLIDGLKKIRDGITMVIDFYEADRPAVCSVEYRAPDDVIISDIPELPVDYDIASIKINKSELDSMGYTDLKKLAIKYGVANGGTRDEITKKILSVSKKAYGAVKPIDMPETTTATPEIMKDDIYDFVCNFVDGKSDTFVRSLLDSAGYPTVGKRETLIDTIAQGIRVKKFIVTGDEIELANDAELGAGEKNVIDLPSRGFDVNDAHNPRLTEARAMTIIGQEKATAKALKEGTVTLSELKEFVLNYYKDVDNFVLDDKNIVVIYNRVTSMFIGDDGEFHTKGFYKLSGMPACCGKILTKNANSGNYECPKCGGVYGNI